MRSGRDLARELANRNEGAREVTQEYESRSRLGRFIMFRDPRVRAQVQYVKAQDSIGAARLSTQENEANIILGFGAN